MKDDGSLLFLLPIVLVIAAAQVTATQLTRLAQDDGFDAPFFVTWVHASQMSVLSCPTLAWCLPSKPSDDAVVPLRPLLTCLLFFLVANFSFVKALTLAPASYVQTIFGTAPVAVAALSACLLREPFTLRRLFAVLCAGAGALCLSWDGSAPGGGKYAAGVALAEVAVASAAAYKVGFKLKFGSPSPRFVLRFIGKLGTYSACAGAPVALALFAFGVEERPADARRWLLILAGGFVDLVYNFSIAFGLAVSPSPVYVSVATMLAIPASAAVDALLHHLPLSVGQLVGTAAIIVSFGALATERNVRGPLSNDADQNYSRVETATCSPPHDQDDAENAGASATCSSDLQSLRIEERDKTMSPLSAPPETEGHATS